MSENDQNIKTTPGDTDASCAACTAYEINEEQLGQISGGGRTENRFDPKYCKNLKYKRDNICAGTSWFSAFVWCDHYRESDVFESGGREAKRISCVMNAFPSYVVYKT